MHLKSIEKYEWIKYENIYHYTKFEDEQKLLYARGYKKRNMYLNSSGYYCSHGIQNPLLPTIQVPISIFRISLHKCLFILKV